jgi:hypothetical protein
LLAKPMKHLIQLSSGSRIEPAAECTQLKCRIAELDLCLGWFAVEQ